MFNFWWNKEIWIAKRIKTEKNVEGIDIEYFDTPVKYVINYQPLSAEQSLQEYGEHVSDVYRATIPRSIYEGVFHSGDRAYLSDENFKQDELEQLATNDDEHCTKSNYVINTVLVQNLLIRIDFLKRR